MNTPITAEPATHGCDSAAGLIPPGAAASPFPSFARSSRAEVPSLGVSSLDLAGRECPASFPQVRP